MIRRPCTPFLASPVLNVIVFPVHSLLVAVLLQRPDKILLGSIISSKNRVPYSTYLSANSNESTPLRKRYLVGWIQHHQRWKFNAQTLNAVITMQHDGYRKLKAVHEGQTLLGQIPHYRDLVSLYSMTNSRSRCPAFRFMTRTT